MRGDSSKGAFLLPIPLNVGKRETMPHQPGLSPAFEPAFEFLSNSELKYSGQELHVEKQCPETVVHKERAAT